MENLPKNNSPKELEEIKKMREGKMEKLRKKFIKETEEEISRILDQEEAEARQKKEPR